MACYKKEVSRICSVSFYCSGNLTIKRGLDVIFDGFCNGKKTFNLKKGIYTFEGAIYPPFDFSEPFDLPLLELPKKDYDKRKKTVLNFDPDNPSPASIEIESGNIYLNRRFLNLPYYAQFYILAHEEGHLLYDGEFESDMYALNECVKAFIPISMCFKAQSEILSEGAENRERKERIEQLVNKLNKQIKIN